MAVIIVLLVSFLGSIGVSRLWIGDWNYIMSGNIAMCIMLLFTAMGHFKFPKGMAMMVPKFIPYKTELVYLTGFIEIVAGLALLFTQFRNVAGWYLILFFVAILPANIYAAMHRLDYQKGTYDGKGMPYLWFRVPMQIFLILWVWYFAIYHQPF